MAHSLALHEFGDYWIEFVESEETGQVQAKAYDQSRSCLYATDFYEIVNVAKGAAESWIISKEGGKPLQYQDTFNELQSSDEITSQTRAIMAAIIYSTTRQSPVTIVNTVNELVKALEK